MLSHKQCPVDEILEIRCNIAMRTKEPVEKPAFLSFFSMIRIDGEKIEMNMTKNWQIFCVISYWLLGSW
jgi:hypothetical protein